MLNHFQAVFRYFRAAVPFRLTQAIITTGFLVILLLLPVPDGLTPKAWALLAIFLTTILAHYCPEFSERTA
jgi:DASS family divalent anion:Na+ symporter